MAIDAALELAAPALYRAVDVAMVPLGAAQEVLYRYDSRSSELCQAALVAAVRVCLGSAPLDVHRERLRVKGLPESAVEDLLARGLLVPDSDLGVPVAGEPHKASAGRRIGMIGIPTIGRPMELRRALSGFAREAVQHNSDIELVVLDDSSDPELNEDSQAAVTDTIRQSGVRAAKVGTSERTSFASRLARCTGVDADLIRFAVSNPMELPAAYGAARNSLVLGAAGASILQVDDDSVCALAAPPEPLAGLVLTSEPDPTEFWFAEDLDLDRYPRATAEGCIEAHEELLGKNVAQLVEQAHGNVDMRGFSTRSVTHMHRQNGTVVAVMMGVIGDSGISRPAYFLLPDTSLGRLTRSESVYRSNVASRNVLRCARRKAVSDAPFCMAGNLSLDTGYDLPPFPPVLRGEDAVFGTVMAACSCGEQYFGFSPWALEHRPSRQHLSDKEQAIEFAARPRANDLLCGIIALSGVSSQAGTGVKRMARLGLYLADFAALPVRDFVEAVTVWTAKLLGRQILALENRLHQNGAKPAYWAADVRSFVECTRRLVASGDHSVPADLERYYSRESAWDVLQSIMRQYGRLLQVWPELMNAARRLNASGEGLILRV